ncbi:unnamed protein product [Moneuplotes crassus]|uniref:Uncharacterized protein n=1 Tax=Euplotes crassus TaxID=5936 RepID=A0AAD1UCB4_EUPCR|nr:unnamed protein product [Moneuplotes crassus]
MKSQHTFEVKNAYNGTNEEEPGLLIYRNTFKGNSSRPFTSIESGDDPDSETSRFEKYKNSFQNTKIRNLSQSGNMNKTLTNVKHFLGNKTIFINETQEGTEENYYLQSKRKTVLETINKHHNIIKDLLNKSQIKKFKFKRNRNKNAYNDLMKSEDFNAENYQTSDCGKSIEPSGQDFKQEEVEPFQTVQTALQKRKNCIIFKPRPKLSHLQNKRSHSINYSHQVPYLHSKISNAKRIFQKRLPKRGSSLNKSFKKVGLSNLFIKNKEAVLHHRKAPSLTKKWDNIVLMSEISQSYVNIDLFNSSLTSMRGQNQNKKHRCASKVCSRNMPNKRNIPIKEIQANNNYKQLSKSLRRESRMVGPSDEIAETYFPDSSNFQIDQNSREACSINRSIQKVDTYESLNVEQVKDHQQTDSNHSFF